MDTRSDAELLASGVADDFGVFYERHVRVVTAYLARRTGRADVTFDLVAETFARALENRARHSASRGPAVAWLLAVARNLLIDAARRGRVADSARVRLSMTRIELDDDALERASNAAAPSIFAPSFAGCPPSSVRRFCGAWSQSNPTGLSPTRSSAPSRWFVSACRGGWQRCVGPGRDRRERPV